MATIDRSLLRTGFDVEALFTGRYLQALLTAAYDAGIVGSTHPLTSTDAAGNEVVADTVVLWQPDGIRRLYPALDVPLANGDHVDTWASDEQFATEILVGDPRGAKLRVTVSAGTLSVPLPGVFHGLLDAQLLTQTADGATTSVGLDIRLLDVETDAFTWDRLEANGVTHDALLARVAPSIDRVIALDAIAKGQRVESVQIRWLPEGDAGEPVLAVFLNLHLRTTDEPGHHLPARGDVLDAVNFLPAGQDVAMATRDGLYTDARNDTWSRLASPDGSGWEHPLRKTLLDPDSERVGDVRDVRIGRIPPRLGPSGTLVPQHGLRLQIDAHYVASAPATTDLTMTVDLRPRVDGDGMLQWDTDVDVDVDAVLEWFTGWVIAFAAIAFGPIGAGIALGSVVAIEIGAGVYYGRKFDTEVHDRVDATLQDVIPDRLTVATVRWDPFYATRHQVVVQPSQVEFGDDGFSLCGTVAIGRELVPPVDTVLQRPVRDAADALTGLAYRVPGDAVVSEDALAPGTHRRGFTPADPATPDVFELTLDELRGRRDDPDGALVLTHLPYFPAAVHVVGHQIAHLMGIAASQLEIVRRQLRTAWKTRVFAEVETMQGATIRAAVVTDLSAGGATPTDAQIAEELEVRIQAIVDARADDEFHPPAPLDMVLDGSTRDQLSFDLTPEEWLLVQREEFVALDPAVRAVHGVRVVDHLRDEPDPGPDGLTRDNLLERPRYVPGPDGPVFRS